MVKAGFKFPEQLTRAEIDAFRRYEERVKQIMEDYRHKVDKLNADYDTALATYGDEYDRKLKELSDLHDSERLQKSPICQPLHPHPERLSIECRGCGGKLPEPVENYSDAWCRACVTASDVARDQRISVADERWRLLGRS
jgi:hypothetical protein